MNTPHLFSPFRTAGIELRNRIVVSPMCEYSSQNGFANDWHLVHLGCRAVGGAGLVFTEASAVTPEGRISPDDLGIWSDEHIPFLRRITDFIHAQGAASGMQLAHAGRKASTAAPWKGEKPGGKPIAVAGGGWEVVGPSPEAFAPGYPVPHELALPEIAAVVDAFAAAARRAGAAGFQVLEIHAAHGYLIHEFLSPLSNHRNDAFGGSFENRARLLAQIVAAIRAVWERERPLWVRIAATDWTPGGWDLADSIALARLLAPLGVDLFDCSTAGNLPSAEIPLGPGYQTTFAEAVRRESGLPTAAVGMITSPQQADHIIRTGQADCVALARQLLRDPYWPLRAAHRLGHPGPWPKQYLRAQW